MKLRLITGLATSLLALTVSENVLAKMDVFVSLNPPEPREIVGPPGGFMQCYDVPAGFYNGHWVNSYRACDYQNSPYGEVWVQGYWRCQNYVDITRTCINWKWIPSHWTHRRGYEFQAVPYRFRRHHGFNPAQPGGPGSPMQPGWRVGEPARPHSHEPMQPNPHRPTVVPGWGGSSPSRPVAVPSQPMSPGQPGVITSEPSARPGRTEEIDPSTINEPGAGAGAEPMQPNYPPR